MNRYLHWLGRICALLALIFFCKEFWESFKEIPGFNLDLGSVLAFALSVVYSAITFAGTALVAMILLRGGGIPITFPQSYEIIGRSQIGKYLPGNIFHHVGQVALGSQKGIPAEKSVVSIWGHTAVIVIAGSSVAYIGFLLDASGWSSSVALATRAALTGGVTKFLIVVVACLVLSLFFKKTRAWIGRSQGFFSPRSLLLSYSIYLLIFLLYGIVCAFILSFFWSVDLYQSWYFLASGYALAWVLGFVVPGAPSGIGIRESVLLLVFSPVLGQGNTLGLAVIMRISAALGDLLTFMIASRLHTGSIDSSDAQEHSEDFAGT
jgi:glycosyltransferase 2 family protein